MNIYLDIYDSDKEQESWQFAQQQAVLDQPKDERTIVDRDGEGLVRTKRDESNHKVRILVVGEYPANQFYFYSFEQLKNVSWN